MEEGAERDRAEGLADELDGGGRHGRRRARRAEVGVNLSPTNRWSFLF